MIREYCLGILFGYSAYAVVAADSVCCGLTLGDTHDSLTPLAIPTLRTGLVRIQAQVRGRYQRRLLIKQKREAREEGRLETELAELRGEADDSYLYDEYGNKKASQTTSSWRTSCAPSQSAQLIHLRWR